MSTTSRIARRATAAGAVMSIAAACMSIANALTMPTLTRPRRSVADRVVVCVPARNEVTTLPALIGDLRAQSGCPNLRVIVLDDGSSDGTYEAAVTAAGEDPRFHVIRSDVEPPPGWTGKAAACHRLAQSALAEPADHIAFVDADVRLDPAAVAAASETLGTRDAALVSPWPRQITGSPAETLVQ
ncbi:MAG: glycosyltransferase family 2 protein, partial [Rhodococcus sp. (in: high G+C Gram-positive bacteria)]